jgi:membrane-associated phospholipid phosphatase
MKTIRKIVHAGLLLSLGWLAAASTARGSNIFPTRNDGATQAGNVLAYALPAAAFGLTLGLKDRDGSWQFGESVAVTMGLTVAFKYTVNATRPNGEGHTFPSGHAAISFSAAEFLRKRYGWEYGVPAYVLAAYVGYSRIHAHEHRFRDVGAGAILGVASSYLITKPYHGWNVQPMVDVKSYGFSASRDF